jgi:hypothetical protein
MIVTSKYQKKPCLWWKNKEDVKKQIACSILGIVFCISYQFCLRNSTKNNNENYY